MLERLCTLTADFIAWSLFTYFVYTEMTLVDKKIVLSLYRSLIRETKKWNAYNYRMYTLRKVKHEFAICKNLDDERLIKERLKEGQNALEMIKRQVIIGNLYSTKPLVIEDTK